MSNENTEVEEEVVETTAPETPSAEETERQQQDHAAAQQRQAEESEARQMGWRPQTEFRGDPGKWVEAKEFIRRGKEHLPIKVSRLERELQESREANKTFAEFVEKSHKATVQKLESEINGLKAQKAAAAEAGDTKAMLAADNALEGKREELASTKDAAPKPAAAPNAEPPEVVAFYDRNPLVASDEDLHAFANGHVRTLMTKGVALADALTKTEDAMRRAYPEKFVNPRRSTTGAVEGGGAPAGGGAPTNKRTYQHLPAEAKAACDKFCKQIPGYTKEKYLAAYQWD